jgi:hypothetical protein
MVCTEGLRGLTVVEELGEPVREQIDPGRVWIYIIAERPRRPRGWSGPIGHASTVAQKLDNRSYPPKGL